MDLLLQFFQRFNIDSTANVMDSIFLEGMKRSLATNEMMSQGDYIIVDKPTSFDIFPYRNNNNNHNDDNSSNNSNNNNDDNHKRNNYF